MKIFVKDDRVLSAAGDAAEVEISGCQVYYVPDGTVIWGADGPVNFSDLGITQADSDIYEAKAKLRDTDPEMARVTEDLIDLLVGKSLITVAELPQEAQDKITARQAWRSTIQGGE